MSEATGKSTRHVYMDVVRIVGCVLVILLHMATLDVKSFSTTGIEWKVMNFMDSVGMTGISFFFMISGALFLRSDADVSLKYIWKKIGILLLVYVVSLFCYNIIPFVKGWEPWELYYLKVDLLGNILLGEGIYHLGFLPTLMVLYALTPILKDAFASKKNCEYFLILFAVFGAAIPLALRFEFDNKLVLQSFQDRFGLFFLTGHIGYFVLGHYLHEFVGKLNRKQVVVAVLVTIGASIFTIMCNHVDAVARNDFSTIANTPLSLSGWLFAGSVYMLIKTGMADYQSAKGARILKYLSSLTFGIYLIHPFIMNTFIKPYPWSEVIGVYGLLVVSRILFVIVVSALITAILKKIPLLKKVL